MTPRNENPREPKYEKRLESILQTVRSIDRNVESILDKMNEYFDDTGPEPAWAKDYDTDFNHNDY